MFDPHWLPSQLDHGGTSGDATSSDAKDPQTLIEKDGIDGVGFWNLVPDRSLFRVPDLVYSQNSLSRNFALNIFCRYPKLAALEVLFSWYHMTVRFKWFKQWSLSIICLFKSLWLIHNQCPLYISSQMHATLWVPRDTAEYSIRANGCIYSIKRMTWSLARTPLILT